MRVSKWGNSLAVRIPRDVAEALGIKEGDDIDLCRAEAGRVGVSRELSRGELIQRIRDMARPLPKNYKFDREEANAR